MTPTQTRYPWRATARTLLAALVGAISLAPVIAATSGLDTVPAVTQVVLVCGAVTRVLAQSQVDAWLREHAPWLASAPRTEVAPGR